MTAVEFLIEQICGEHTEAWKEEIQQALEIEKQQIKEAYNFSEIPHLFKWHAEQYYNETYKKS